MTLNNYWSRSKSKSTISKIFYSVSPSALIYSNDDLKMVFENNKLKQTNKQTKYNKTSHFWVAFIEQT